MIANVNTNTCHWVEIARSMLLMRFCASFHKKITTINVFQTNFERLEKQLTSSSLNQMNASDVSTNQYSLEPPFRTLTFRRVNQPFLITCVENAKHSGHQELMGNSLVVLVQTSQKKKKR